MYFYIKNFNKFYFSTKLLKTNLTILLELLLLVLELKLKKTKL